MFRIFNLNNILSPKWIGMRSLNLRRLKSFFTLDLPVNYRYLYTSFRQSQDRQRYIHANWPTTATRQKLIANYWENTLVHYLLLITISTTMVVLFSIGYSQHNNIYLPVLFLVGIMAYLPIYFIIYRPTFNREFLPNLETVSQ